MRVLLVALLLLAPAAMAQVPEVSTASVTIGVPAGPDVVPLGGNLERLVSVDLKLNNVFCPNEVTGAVSLSVADIPSALPGVQTKMTPSEVPFTLAAGASNHAVTGEATLNISVAATTLGDHEHGFNITATFNPSSLSGPCLGFTPSGASVPGASDSASTQIKTGPAPKTNATLDGSSSSSTSKSSFLLTVPFQVLALAALVAVRRR